MLQRRNLIYLKQIDIISTEIIIGSQATQKSIQQWICLLNLCRAREHSTNLESMCFSIWDDGIVYERNFMFRENNRVIESIRIDNKNPHKIERIKIVSVLPTLDMFASTNEYESDETQTSTSVRTQQGG
jgi:hypothetical protein